ncbi:sugar ABC transporter substrate-binding protein [Amycolatopsis thermoflava]|uniref:sugar ABC transporter substrate-binding protein n=1 Tax=Amycolatopsis thermoflava TaxID=84480 RepID=UPI0003FF6129|nr:substrate-binding domain-containing protein [Amycolatopsis thermoflava]
MRLSTVAAVAAALLMPWSLAGCGSPTSSVTGTSADSPDAAEAAAAVQAASGEPVLTASLGTALAHPADLTGKTIYYIPLSLQVATFTNQLAGLQQALTKVGATVKSCDGQLSPTGVAQCIDQAIGARAHAVVTSSISYEMASTAFSRLTGAGIPTLLTGTEPVAAAPTGLHFLSQGWYQRVEARLAAQAVIADSNAQAKVLYLRTSDSKSMVEMGAAGIDELKTGCPDCRVNVIDVAGTQVSQLPSIVSGALLKNPSIDYVIPQTDNWVPGVLTGIQNAGATSRMKMASTTAILGSLQILKSNPVLIADVGASPNYIGWAIADSAIRMLSSEPVPAGYPPLVRVFTKDNIGTLQLTPQAETGNDWYGSAPYVAGFEKLWGVS